MEDTVKPEVRVDLYSVIRFLYEHLTEAMIESVWLRKRVKERRREWTLTALVRFWTAVVMRAPASLSHAIQAMLDRGDLIWPTVRSTPEGFFQRCRDLHWRFFAEVFVEFVRRVTDLAEPVYASGLTGLREHFPEVWVVDGSRLDQIARKLKILWDERAVILPGCLLVVYDLFRGVTRQLHFDPDAARSELERAIWALADIPRGVLLVADRLYAVPKFFVELSEKGLFLLTRPRKRIKLRKLALLSKGIGPGFVLEDWLVELGGAASPTCRLRYIRVRGGRKVFELLTNVLEPGRLSAADAFALYRARWSVERVFFDLKEVLNLNCFYAANHNAVAMQVYATAIVYVAFRIGQGRVAQQHGIPPDEISPAKFFPVFAAAANFVATANLIFAEIHEMNPGKDIQRPPLDGRRQTTVALPFILVRHRSERRRHRRYCPARRRWKSLRRVPGGLKLT